MLEDYGSAKIVGYLLALILIVLASMGGVSFIKAMIIESMLHNSPAYFVIPDEKLKNVVDVKNFNSGQGLLSPLIGSSLPEADVSYPALVKLAGNNTVYRVTSVEHVYNEKKIVLELDYYFVKDHVVYHAERVVTAALVAGKHLSGARAINASIVNY